MDKPNRSITGIAEVALRVHNLDLMRSFYEQVIGFKVLREIKESNGAVVFYAVGAGNDHLALFEEKWVDWFTRAVGQTMKQNAGLKVDISGFADKTGNAAQNFELAKQRAIVVRDALKAAGVAEDRMNLAKPVEVILGAGQDAEGRRVEINAAK